MQYKKITKNGYNLYIIPTDKFTTNKLNIKFIIPAEKEKITSLKVLSSYIYKANNKYPSFKDLVLNSEDKYIINFNNGFNVNSNNFIFGHTIDFLEEQYTSLEFLGDTIDFFLNSILNINFKNEQQFEVVLNKVEKDILRLKDNREKYAGIRFMETLFPNDSISYRMTGYLDDLKKITLESLSEYYDYIINNAQIDVFVAGNIDEELLITNLDKWLGNRDNKKLSFETKLLPVRKEVLIEKEQIDANQSNLYLGFKIEEMTEYEESAVLSVLSYVYGGGGSSILFDVVREKNSLCYTVHASANRIHRYVGVYAGISSENFDKAKDLIIAELNNMKDQSYDEDLILNAKKTITNDLISIQDSKGAIIDYIGSHIHLGSMLIEKRIPLIDKVTKEDISKLIEKISLDTIYFLEGVQDEKTRI
jgi:predicted Zn-dependent peptidase